MSHKLYRVIFIRQDNGEEQEQYVLAKNLTIIDDTYSDIIRIEPLNLEEL